MGAIVILFKGSTPDQSQIIRGIDQMHFIKEATSINVLSDENVAKLLVRATRAPKLSTEEGDAAVTVLAGITNMANDCVFVTQIFSGLREHNPAIVRACSVLSQDYPVSDAICSKYSFTEDKRRIIKQFYNEYNKLYVKNTLQRVQKLT